MDIQVKIASRIKQLRSEQNLTQEAVAFKADVNRTYMNHVETGKRNISIATLEKIVCQGLDSNLREFFNDALFNSKRRGQK